MQLAGYFLALFELVLHVLLQGFTVYIELGIYWDSQILNKNRVFKADIYLAYIEKYPILVLNFS